WPGRRLAQPSGTHCRGLRVLEFVCGWLRPCRELLAAGRDAHGDRRGRGSAQSGCVLAAHRLLSSASPRPCPERLQLRHLPRWRYRTDAWRSCDRLELASARTGHSADRNRPLLAGCLPGRRFRRSLAGSVGVIDGGAIAPRCGIGTAEHPASRSNRALQETVENVLLPQRRYRTALVFWLWHLRMGANVFHTPPPLDRVADRLGVRCVSSGVRSIGDVFGRLAR